MNFGYKTARHALYSGYETVKLSTKAQCLAIDACERAVLPGPLSKGGEQFYASNFTPWFSFGSRQLISTVIYNHSSFYTNKLDDLAKKK